MSVIIRLQNLPWAANAADIRTYFNGLSIPEGGVHIVGGEQGDAFIAFTTDEDARQAMLRNGGKIKEIQISLYLSSRSEMHKTIEQARQQSLQMLQQVPTASVVPVTSSLLTVNNSSFIDRNETDIERNRRGHSSSRERRGNRSRERSRSRDRSRSRERSRDRSRERRRDRRRRSKSRERRRRSRSRDRKRSNNRRDSRDKDGNQDQEIRDNKKNLKQDKDTRSLQMHNPEPSMNRVSVWENDMRTGSSLHVPQVKEPLISQFPQIIQPGSNISSSTTVNIANIASNPVSKNNQLGGPELFKDDTFPKMIAGDPRNPLKYSQKPGTYDNNNDHNNTVNIGGGFPTSTNWPPNTQPYFLPAINPFSLITQQFTAFNTSNKQSEQVNDSNTCIEIRGLPSYATYIDLKKFFDGLTIASDGIKMINDNQGRRTGIAYVKFTTINHKKMALNQDGKRIRHSFVEVIHLTDKIYESAIDNFKPEKKDVKESNTWPKSETSFDNNNMMNNNGLIKSSNIDFQKQESNRQSQGNNDEQRRGNSNQGFGNFKNVRNESTHNQNNSTNQFLENNSFHQNQQPSYNKMNTNFQKRFAKEADGKGFSNQRSLEFDSYNQDKSTYENDTTSFESDNKKFDKTDYRNKNFYNSSNSSFEKRISSENINDNNSNACNFPAENVFNKQIFYQPENKPSTINDNRNVPDEKVEEEMYNPEDFKIKQDNKHVNQEMWNTAGEDKVMNDANVNTSTNNSSFTSLQPGSPKPVPTDPRLTKRKTEQSNKPIISDCVIMTNVPFGFSKPDVFRFFSSLQIGPVDICFLRDKNGEFNGRIVCRFINCNEAEISLRKDGEYISDNKMGIRLVLKNEVDELIEEQNRFAALQRTEYRNSRSQENKSSGGPIPLMQVPVSNIIAKKQLMNPWMYDNEEEQTNSNEKMPQSSTSRDRDRPSRFQDSNQTNKFMPHDTRNPRSSNMSRNQFNDRRHKTNMNEEDNQPYLKHESVDSFGRPGCVVGMENIHFGAEVEDIVEFFQDYRIIHEDVIRRYGDDGRSTGEARVALQNPQDAMHAVRFLNFKPIRGRQVKLSIVNAL